MPDDPIERSMYVSEEVWRLVDGPWVSEEMSARCGLLRADMEQFVSGRIVGVCLTPYEAKNALFGLLHAPEAGIWDFRSVDPSPGLRLFGAFADTDVFVALTCAPRSVPVEYLARTPLGKAESQAWAVAIRECKAEWRKLFQPYTPHIGGQVSDFVSADYISV
ncbi:MAG: hypothetical protein ACK4X1_01955 [Terricaulis sp.]